MHTLIFEALAYAAHAHRNQRRKDRTATPYVNHCIDVANRLSVVADVDDPVLLAAALLHDTVEDTDVTSDDLKDRFGEHVAALVAQVTDDKSLPKTERKRLQVEHAPTMPPAAKMLKIADKISNVHDVANDPPANWPVGRRLDYLEWASTVVDGCRGVNAALEAEFDRVAASARRTLTPSN